MQTKSSLPLWQKSMLLLLFAMTGCAHQHVASDQCYPRPPAKPVKQIPSPDQFDQETEAMLKQTGVTK